jgi:hypothetical protein
MRNASLGPQQNKLEWPSHGRFLIPGVNNTWNAYQIFCRGKVKVPTTADWKEARKVLLEEYTEFLKQGGTPLEIEGHSKG